MAVVKFYKVNTLPGTLEANAFYYVENGNFAESYITNSSGIAKAVGNTSMITSIVNDAIVDAIEGVNTFQITSNIAERDGLDLNINTLVLVIDASGDSSVNTGSALYAYNATTEAFVKVAEYESMDVVIEWSNIQGRPSSTPAQIDSAVTAAHTHSNKSTLDKFGESDGNVTFNGQAIQTTWTTVNW